MTFQGEWSEDDKKRIKMFISNLNGWTFWKFRGDTGFICYHTGWNQPNMRIRGTTIDKMIRAIMSRVHI